MVRRIVTLTGTLTVLVVRRTLTRFVAISVLRKVSRRRGEFDLPKLDPGRHRKVYSLRLVETLRESPLRRGSQHETNPAERNRRGC